MSWLITSLIVLCTFSGYVSAVAKDNNYVIMRHQIAVTTQDKSHGAIKGIVLDKTTRKPLVGVNVTVEGTRFGAATNRKGEFLISKLSAATYTLHFSMIGYAEIKRGNIEVTGNDTLDLRIHYCPVKS